MNTRPQESVADYPRPPAIEHVDRAIHASVGGHVIIDTQRPIRILETFHPPVYYIPPADVSMQFLEPSPHTSYCEFKGQAHYYSLVVDGEKRSNVAWYYPNPSPGYEDLADHIAFLRVGARRGHRRWRAGHSAAGPLLRWLDNERDHGTEQGQSRHHRLVTPASFSASSARQSDR